MPPVSPPPLSFRHRNDEGYFEIPWQQFFLQQQQAAAASAPAEAGYIVSTADPDLPNAQSLGALDTGWIHSVRTGSTGVITNFPVVYQDLEPVVDVTIPANMGAVVPDRFTLDVGRTLTIEAGGVFAVV